MAGQVGSVSARSRVTTIQCEKRGLTLIVIGRNPWIRLYGLPVIGARVDTSGYVAQFNALREL